MREIRFRGKRVDNGEWVYGFVGRIDCYESGKQYEETVIIEELKYDDGDCYVQEFIYADPVDPDTVGQYTGLKDKNGVKIYEGDIVEFSHGGVVRAYVRSDNGAYDVVNEKDDVLLYLHAVNHKARIIGNIYDNPELVEGKK